MERCWTLNHSTMGSWGQTWTPFLDHLFVLRLKIQIRNDENILTFLSTFTLHHREWISLLSHNSEDFFSFMSLKHLYISNYNVWCFYWNILSGIIKKGFCSILENKKIELFFYIKSKCSTAKPIKNNSNDYIFIFFLRLL